MAFSRGQTQILYQFLPGAVFEHDQYGFCRVKNVEFRETRTNQDALFNAVSDLLAQWLNDQSRPGFADPRNRPNRRYYVAGTPTSVRFAPYPTLLECRGCRRVFRLRDLMRRPNAQPRRCPTCQGTLGQLRYVQAHNCGRLEEIYYPGTACRAHGSCVSYLRRHRACSVSPLEVRLMRECRGGPAEDDALHVLLFEISPSGTRISIRARAQDARPY